MLSMHCCIRILRIITRVILSTLTHVKCLIATIHAAISLGISIKFLLSFIFLRVTLLIVRIPSIIIIILIFPLSSSTFLQFWITFVISLNQFLRCYLYFYAFCWHIRFWLIISMMSLRTTIIYICIYSTSIWIWRSIVVVKVIVKVVLHVRSQNLRSELLLLWLLTILTDEKLVDISLSIGILALFHTWRHHTTIISPLWNVLWPSPYSLPLR